MIENKIIVLTFDVEDWFQVENLRPWMPPPSWENLESRVERNTETILDIIDCVASIKSFRKKPKVTFFLLGWIVKRFPRIAREIDRRGHEVASHGFDHLLCSGMSADELKVDLLKSKNLLEDTIGKPVWGYRAPSFSISDDVLRIVQTCGYRYDSSFNNFDMHGRYGRLEVRKYLSKGNTYKVGKEFFEIPLSNLNLLGKIIPWAGGGYFRLLPFALFQTGVRYILRKKGNYVFYAHPWEFDPGQPFVKKASLVNRLKHYNNLSKTSNRLTSFMTSFSDCRFLTCHDYLNEIWGKYEK